MTIGGGGVWPNLKSSSPVTRQAIQNFILGGGSALRQQAGSYDQLDTWAVASRCDQKIASPATAANRITKKTP